MGGFDRYSGRMKRSHFVWLPMARRIDFKLMAAALIILVCVTFMVGFVLHWRDVEVGQMRHDPRWKMMMRIKLPSTQYDDKNKSVFTLSLSAQPISLLGVSSHFIGTTLERDYLAAHDSVKRKEKGQPKQQHIPPQPINRKGHLTCSPYVYSVSQKNGNEDTVILKNFKYNDEVVRGMVYWQNIPSDWHFTSPYANGNTKEIKRQQEQQYVTFEIDIGGWNNVRMAFETVAAIAYAMGRTLVLPPVQEIYLLYDSTNLSISATNNSSVKQSLMSTSLQHIFSLYEAIRKYKGFHIISTEDFLKQEIMTGKIRDRSSGKMVFPPNNRTNWDGCNPIECNELYDQLFENERIAAKSTWNPETCVVLFPKKTSPNVSVAVSDESLASLLYQFQSKTNITNETSVEDRSYEQYINHPTPVHGSSIDRLMEIRNGRTSLCVYTDDNVKETPVLHFVGGRKPEQLHNGRLLTPFYAFLFFEDWKHDLIVKRFIRDAIRYNDQIQCAAARIVTAIKSRVAASIKSELHNVNNYPAASFDAFHVRHGDFQYKKTKISSQEMYDIAKDLIPDGRTVYIATDDVAGKRRKKFFHNMSRHYDLVFLDDFKNEFLQDIHPNWYGMVEQLVLSQSHIFFGCWFSTFTSYVNRLRGYHVDLQKGPGFQLGIIPSYYYALEKHKYRMRQYWPVSGMVYAREFPIGWRNIDQGITEEAPT